MTYLQLHNQLVEAFRPDLSQAPLIDDLTLTSLDFISGGPKGLSQKCLKTPEDLLTLFTPEIDLSSLFEIPDDEIKENKRFRYHIIQPKTEDKSSKTIILLHGLNERHWSKYLPIAVNLCRKTKKSVVLFPIAFHMNRSPELWNNAKIMYKVSQWRKAKYPNIVDSTLSNVAISLRLQEDPARFFWSGLETYENIISLVKSIRLGQHPVLAQEADIDFFTYSIGTFLGEIIMLANQDGLFDRSRLVAFCGGPVFNRLSSVSKFILDSEADVAIYSYLIEHLESHRKIDQNLDEFLNRPGAGPNFLAMLNYRLNREYRESRLRSLAGRIKAVAMAKDEVVPSFEVINTLKGSNRDIDIEVTVVDPPYPYRHEDPFPTSAKYESLVDEWFDRIIGELSDFLI
ncbi:MAG: DUF6051 family protein [Deltaproteobacteria bacterium]|jgi:hypothetical protein|nr:DUF6051 family protein [Deltaproteobacteria bacterium]